MQLHELPRDNTGQIHGRYRLRHVSPEFSASLGFAIFEKGVTTGPLEGYVLGRIMAGLGCDVSAEPWDAPSVEPNSDLADAQPFVAYPADLELAGDSAVGSEQPSLTSVKTPTSWVELEAMTDEELKVAAADLGNTDKRFGSPKRRIFIAEQLGIDIPGADHDQGS